MTKQFSLVIQIFSLCRKRRFPELVTFEEIYEAATTVAMNNFPNVQMYTRAFQVEENVGNERLEEDAKFCSN